MTAIKAVEPVKLMKIMFVGDTNVGKSVFLHKFVKDEFKESFIPTVGIDFMKKEIEFCDNAEDEEAPKRKITLQLWDTAGQERYHSITRLYFKSSRAFVLVFDVTREESFKTIDKWVETITSSTTMQNPKIVLCGNKVDLVEKRQVDEETARKKADELGFEYFETSAVSGQNITETIDCLVHLVMTGKVPGEDTDEEEVDEGVVKKEFEKKVNLSVTEEGSKNEEKQSSKCPC